MSKTTDRYLKTRVTDAKGKIIRENRILVSHKKEDLPDLDSGEEWYEHYEREETGSCYYCKFYYIDEWAGETEAWCTINPDFDPETCGCFEFDTGEDLDE